MNDLMAQLVAWAWGLFFILLYGEKKIVGFFKERIEELCCGWVAIVGSTWEFDYKQFKRMIKRKSI